jgi:hypothetical protein
VIRQASITGLSAAGAMALAGCVTDEATRVPFPSGPIRMAPRRTTGVSAGILPLGSVPYDNRSLPLVSPDGSLVATQTGPPPDWSTLLAERDATVPQATRVEVYHLDREMGEVTMLRATNEGILLGRAGDGKGFLVESPRTDGSRWIGYTGWDAGAAEWLVADDNVNAFACLGRDGRLAWSRRAQDAEHFDLVIRNGGEEWTVGAQGGDWLMPVWSDVTDGLFALRLESGNLELTYMNAESPLTTRASLVRLPIASERTRHDAYQCLASVAVMNDLPRRREPFLLFWHPTTGRIGLWRPVTSPGAALMFVEGSISAAIDASGTAVVGTAQQLFAQSPANLADRRALLPGAHVPRRVARSDWPFVLLSPRDNRTGLLAFRVDGTIVPVP